MSANWKVYRLGDITEWSSGGTPSKKNKSLWNGDIPWISASSMYSNRFEKSEHNITHEGVISGSRIAKKDSILLLVRGSTLHNRIPVGITIRDVAFNQDVKSIHPCSDLVNPWYLLYWFMSKEKELLSMVEQTGIGAGKLDTKRLQDLEIKVPPKKEQKRIVEVLKSIDDRLILNEKICEIQKAIGQALFKSWFLDFEPVKAKTKAIKEGNNPELIAMKAISGKSETVINNLRNVDAEVYEHLSNTASLFSQELVNSKLGLVPTDCLPGVIGNIVHQRTGRVGSEKPVVLSAVASGNLVSSDNFFTKRVYSKEINKYIKVEQWDFAYNPSRINIGSVGIHEHEYTGAVSPIYVVFRPHENYRWFIYFLLQRSEIKEWINKLASGGVRQSLSFTNFASIPVTIPPIPLIKTFNKIWLSFYCNIKDKSRQSARLVDIRDGLLRKLILS